MSGLEKFQGSEAWLARFKNLLQMERERTSPVDTVRPAAVSPSHSRYSFDLRDDFQSVLEEKIIPKKLVASKMQDDKENIPKHHNTPTKTVLSSTSLSLSKSASIKAYSRHSDYDSIRDHNDSTILEDISVWRQTSDASFESMELMCNKSVTDPNSTLFQYINDTAEYTAAKIDDSLKKHADFNKSAFADQTQLDDVEEPSILWENTIAGSPAKMVGRPSTILEESRSFCESDQSSSSFKTAQKTVETTSCFETANETISSQSTNRARPKIDFMYKKLAFYGSIDTSSSSMATYSDVSNDTNKSKNTLDDISSLVEDSLNDNCHVRKVKQSPEANNSSKVNEYTFSKLAYKSEQSDEKFIEDESIIVLSDDDLSEGKDHGLNQGFSLQLGNESSMKISDEAEESLNFNDTIEEMEYIMKKGMKYMTDSKVLQKVDMTPIRTSPPRSLSPITPRTVIAKPPPTSMDKSKLQQELFKRPTTKIPQSKSVLSVKKHFDYVKSPVGAYIKNTPKTPTMVMAKTTGESYSSKVIQKLEYESRSNVQKKQPATSSSILPKKAYISAEYKHVMDERTPVTIPGGDKIHRYLQTAKLPAVVRHEGKIKMNMGQNKSNVPQIDDSFADLSIMSGDVSLYTIRDAQKF